jgi:hypothetical protein
LFLTAGLWAANLSADQYFAADFPVDAARHGHAAWGNRFFFGTVLLRAVFLFTLACQENEKRGVISSDHTAPVVP